MDIVYLARTCKRLYRTIDKDKITIRLEHVFDALTRGNTALIDYIGPFPLSRKTYARAISWNDVDVLKALDRRGCPKHGNCINIAAAYSTREVLQYLYDEGHTIFGNAITWAVRMGHLDNIVWFYDLRNEEKKKGIKSWTSDPASLYESIVFGHTQITDYLLRNGCNPQWATSAAAKLGNIDALESFVEQGFPISSDTFDAATESGDFEIMKKLDALAFSPNDKTFQKAIVSCPIDILEWLCVRGFPRDPGTFAFVIIHRDLDTAKWAYHKGLPWNHVALEEAIRIKDLQKVKWLYKHRCEVDSKLLEHAARKGNVQILAWLIDHRCPGSRRSALLAAIEEGNLENAKYMRHKCRSIDRRNIAPPFSNATIEMMRWLADEFGIELRFEWLVEMLKVKNWIVADWMMREHDIPITYEGTGALYFLNHRASALLVDYMRFENPGVDKWLQKKIIKIVWKKGYWDLVKRMLEKGFEFPPKLVVDAIKQDNYPIILWLIDNNYPISYGVVGYIAEKHGRSAREIILENFDLHQSNPRIDLPPPVESTCIKYCTWLDSKEYPYDYGRHLLYAGKTAFDREPGVKVAVHRSRSNSPPEEFIRELLESDAYSSDRSQEEQTPNPITDSPIDREEIREESIYDSDSVDYHSRLFETPDGENTFSDGDSES
jgi:hypothetical protein